MSDRHKEYKMNDHRPIRNTNRTTHTLGLLRPVTTQQGQVGGDKLIQVKSPTPHTAFPAKSSTDH